MNIKLRSPFEAVAEGLCPELELELGEKLVWLGKAFDDWVERNF